MKKTINAAYTQKGRVHLNKLVLYLLQMYLDI